MKTSTLLACCLVATLAILPRAAHAQAQEVSFDFFYTSLADDGDWYNTPEYGYVWQPSIGYNNDKWRPYTDGYWAQTDDGWTWVSYESFGWATYHYGRWTRLKDLGWAWVPGYDWGPGWVSWRTNDDYVGWAPLPPKRERAVYEGRVVSDDNAPAPVSDTPLNYNDVEEDYSVGYTPSVDEDYDIGPQNYCFVECRQFGAPVLREVILPPQQNFVYVENTVNVTNIIYRSDRGGYERGRGEIYNNGPDFNFLSRRSERPIQQLRLDRRNDVAFVRDGLRNGGNPTQVRNGVLQVAAPAISRQPVDLRQMKPGRVKRDLPKAEVVHGWQGANANQQQVAGLREKIKRDAKAPAPAPAANQAEFQKSAAAQVPVPAADRPPVSAGPNAGNREGNLPPGASSLEGSRPRVGGLTPVNPGGVARTEEERAARRDTRQQERTQRSGGQPNGQPANPVNPAATNQPPAAGATAAERRTERQQLREQGGQQAVDQMQKSRAAQQAAEQPKQAQPSAANGTAAERRAERQQIREQGGQKAVDETQKTRAAQQSHAQPQPAAADQAPAQERREHRQERQTERAPQPQSAAPDSAKQQERQERRQERQQQAGQEQRAAQQQEARAAQQQQARGAQQQAAQQQARAAQQQQAPQVQHAAQQQAQGGNREARQERHAEAQSQPAGQNSKADDDDNDKKKKHQQ